MSFRVVSDETVVLILLSYVLCVHAQVKPSFGVTAGDVLRFCMESNPAAYAEHQQGRTTEVVEDEGVQGVQGAAGASPPAECYVQSALVTQSAGAAGALLVMCNSNGHAPIYPSLHFCLDMRNH